MCFGPKFFHHPSAALCAACWQEKCITHTVLCVFLELFPIKATNVCNVANYEPFFGPVHQNDNSDDEIKNTALPKKKNSVA